MPKDQVNVETQDQGGWRLTEEQVADICRRLAKKNPIYVPLDEARLRFIAMSKNQE